MTNKTVHEINDGSGTIITDHWPKGDPDEAPTTFCWWCRSPLIWQRDFTKDEFGIEGEGIVTVRCCSGCGAEVRYIEADEEKHEP